MQEKINALNNSQNRVCLKDESDKINNIINFDYSRFTKEGFELDNMLLEKFQSIVEKLNLSHESLEMLLEIALEMSIKQKSMYEKDDETRYKDNVAKYDQMFRLDSELPDLNSFEINNYMESANKAYSTFASDGLKEVLERIGLNFHPEMIKMFHKIGELMKEEDLSYKGAPSSKELTPAQILYGPRD